MAKSKSEYQIIKEWYQESENAIDAAWRSNHQEDDVNIALRSRVTALVETLTDNNISHEDNERIRLLVIPFVNKAAQDYKGQGSDGVTRKDNWLFKILPTMMQSALHAVAKFFRSSKPTVADLMERAAHIVYEDAQVNGQKYARERAKESQRHGSLGSQDGPPSGIAVQDLGAVQAAGRNMHVMLEEALRVGAPVTTGSHTESVNVLKKS